MEEIKIEQITISKVRKIIDVLIKARKNDETAKENANAEKYDEENE